MLNPKEATRRLFRVDPRLCHATLMNAWVPAVGAEQLLVVDAGVFEDARKTEIMRLAACHVPVEFCVPQRAALALAKLSACPAVIVLFSDLATVEEAMDYGLDVTELNLGHVPAAPGRRAVRPSLHLGDLELSAIQRLHQRGVEVRVQSLPGEEPVPLETLGLVDSAPARPATADLPAQAEPKDGVFEAELEIVNERGLHLRAAHVLAHLSTQAKSEVEVGQDGLMVNAKSLLGLTTLGATKGAKLKVLVKGEDARETMDALKALFASGFGEGAL